MPNRKCYSTGRIQYSSRTLHAMKKQRYKCSRLHKLTSTKWGWTMLGSLAHVTGQRRRRACFLPLGVAYFHMACRCPHNLPWRRAATGSSPRGSATASTNTHQLFDYICKSGCGREKREDNMWISHYAFLNKPWWLEHDICATSDQNHPKTMQGGYRPASKIHGYRMSLGG